MEKKVAASSLLFRMSLKFVLLARKKSKLRVQDQKLID
jgi:hypothetical protein